MQWLGTSYTRRFNLSHQTFGHLFQGRFKSIVVENDAYLLQLSLYIHKNSLRAKIVNRLADYRWSSYPCYAYKGVQSDLVNTRPILSQMGTEDSRKAYRKKIQRYSDEKSRIWEDVKHGVIYGAESFQNHIRNIYLSNGPDRELPQLNRFLRGTSPEALLEKWSDFLKCDIGAFKKAGRLSGEDKDKRDLLRLSTYTQERSGKKMDSYEDK